MFGEFTNLSRYFTDATSGDYIGVQPADEFFCDYLDDRVTNQQRPGPVSGFPRHLRLRRRLDSAYTLAALHRAVTPSPGPEEEKLVGELSDLEREVETARREHRSGRTMNSPTVSCRSKRPGPRSSPSGFRLAPRRGNPGCCVFNPCGFTRRVALEVPGFRGPIPVADPVKAAEFTGDLARLVVEIPPLGFAWVPRKGRIGTPQPKARMKLADGLTVRNEFLECDVDSQTGGIRSFRDLRTRLTRFGQQLVFNPGSKMVARDIAVTNAGTRPGRDHQHGRPHRRPRPRPGHVPPALSRLARPAGRWNCASSST